MQESSTIARPYGLAAFMQARQEGRLAEWSSMLELLETLVRDPGMAGIIASPDVGDRQLAEMVLDVCGERLSATARNFVRILAEKDRLELLPAIRSVFESERVRSEGRSRVEVVSAYELTAEQRDRIGAAMAKRLGTEIDITTTVDRTLIGGVLIRAGDLVIDVSLRGRLDRLGASLA